MLSWRIWIIETEGGESKLIDQMGRVISINKFVGFSVERLTTSRHVPGNQHIDRKN
jgi:hypothetical protein